MKHKKVINQRLVTCITRKCAEAQEGHQPEVSDMYKRKCAEEQEGHQPEVGDMS